MTRRPWLHLFLPPSARIILLLGLGVCGLHCSESPSAPFDGQRAYGDVEAIVALGPRVPGTAESKAAQDYIRRELEAAGLRVHTQRFDAKTPKGTRPMANIYGIVEGTAPGVVILSNHYDTKYMPDIEFVGANDGGSTTGWMIEMARVLGPRRDGRTVWLVFYDGEEAFGDWSDADSLYGSRAFVEHLRETDELGAVEAVINLDMIGDCRLGVFKDTEAAPWLEAAVWETAEDLGYEEYFTQRPIRMDDDHVPLREAGVPAMNLIDFHYGGDSAAHRRNWHTSGDTIEKVCATSLQIVGDVMWHALPRIDRALAQRGR